MTIQQRRSTGRVLKSTTNEPIGGRCAATAENREWAPPGESRGNREQNSDREARTSQCRDLGKLDSRQVVEHSWKRCNILQIKLHAIILLKLILLFKYFKWLALSSLLLGKFHLCRVLFCFYDTQDLSLFTILSPLSSPPVEKENKRPKETQTDLQMKLPTKIRSLCLNQPFPLLSTSNLTKKSWFKSSISFHCLAHH